MIPKLHQPTSNRSFIALVLSLLLSGCGTQWHALRDPTENNPLPSPIRVTTVSGRQVVVYQPTIRGGKIIGLRTKPYDSVNPRGVSVALDSVASVEYGEPKIGNQLAAGSGYAIGTATFAVFAIVAVLALLGGWSYD